MIPKALPSEKQDELFDILAVVYDPEIRRQLIEGNMRLVIHCAKKFSYAYESDDLISIGTIGLIKAVDSFDPNKNFKFSTYAARCIDNEILQFLRTLKKQYNEISLHSSIGQDANGIELCLEQVLLDKHKNIEQNYVENESIRSVLDKLNCLEQLELEFILLYFGFDKYNKMMTQQSIAEMYGISRSYVSRIINRGLKKIRNELDNDVITYENTKKIEKLG